MMKNTLKALSVSLFVLASPLSAQGIPTIDGTQLAQLIQQVQHMAKDFTVQLDQLKSLKVQLETEAKQLLNLEGQLKSFTLGNELSKLLASLKDFEQVKGSIEEPIASLDKIRSGNFTDAFRGGSTAGASVKRTLKDSGFTPKTLKELSSSKEPSDKNIATQASAGALLSAAAEESHKDAGQSIDRLQTMVGHIDNQDGLKAAIDLNTRVTAELGLILTQIWRLEAAAGVSAGQLGVVDAATLAQERKFRSMGVNK